MNKYVAAVILGSSLLAVQPASAGVTCTTYQGSYSSSCSGYETNSGAYVNGDIDRSGTFRGTVDGEYVTCTEYGGCY